MRRIGLLAGVAAIAVSGTAVFGFTQASGASATSHARATIVAGVPTGPQLEPKWTIERIGGSCAVLTFKTGPWTSDMGGNKGTATLSHGTLVLTWTAGTNNGLTFTGTYTAATGNYAGSFGGTSSGAAQLEPGAATSYNGLAC